MGKSYKNIIDRLTEPNFRITRVDKHKRRKLKNYMNYIDEEDDDWDPDMDQDDDEYDDDDDEDEEEDEE